MLLWPITNQHKIERFSPPQDLGVLPAVSEGLKMLFWIMTDQHKNKNILTQGVSEFFFFRDLKAPGGSSTRWTYSRIPVPNSSQCHYRV